MVGGNGFHASLYKLFLETQFVANLPAMCGTDVRESKEQTISNDFLVWTLFATS